VLTSPEKRRAYDFDRAAAASAPPNEDAIAQNYVNQGIAAFKERKYTEAAGNFQLAAHRDPKDVKAQHYLGLASSRAGDMRAAVKAIETAIGLEPHNGTLLRDAGAIFRQAGLLTKAEKAYQEALRWDPSGGDARKALEEIRTQRAGRN